MHLYLHFGIYKTGSSFLQTLCGYNRDLLKEHGYFFPRSEREDDLMAGRISPGNGNGFSKLLKQGDTAKTISLLEIWCREAETNQCTKILISAEALIHALATKIGLETLVTAANELNFKKIKALGFFRDPVDHCLSTYKHRAKRGGLPDFSVWVEQTYETPAVLAQFEKLHRDYPINWSFRKYSKETTFMVKAFWVDWLQMEMPALPETLEVNVSLKLSELLVIQQLASVNRDWIPYVYQAFMDVPKYEKAKDSSLEESYRQVIRQKLNRYNTFFHSWNQLMPLQERLANFSDASESEVTVSEEEAKLSKTQLLALSQAIQKAQEPLELGKTKLKRFYRYWCGIRKNKSKIL
jgi:hypothetical protein